eukprot:TRINITY_DN780_c0_g1_i1.p1 TRINITY_DN780_c0_g1~~TRINITY_DN780_c0_g1_i1.p1  ORF type:complete len:220 (+),score=-23.05 TRINITY_DN780_c0_g1_i1:247-906(+)
MAKQLKNCISFQFQESLNILSFYCHFLLLGTCILIVNFSFSGYISTKITNKYVSHFVVVYFSSNSILSQNSFMKIFYLFVQLSIGNYRFNSRKIIASWSCVNRIIILLQYFIQLILFQFFDRDLFFLQEFFLHSYQIRSQILQVINFLSLVTIQHKTILQFLLIQYNYYHYYSIFRYSDNIYHIKNIRLGQQIKISLKQLTKQYRCKIDFVEIFWQKQR